MTLVLWCCALVLAWALVTMAGLALFHHAMTARDRQARAVARHRRRQRA